MDEAVRRTLVFSVCSWCSALIEVSRRPWSGRAQTVTHGLCDRCNRRLLPGPERFGPRPPDVCVRVPAALR